MGKCPGAISFYESDMESDALKGNFGGERVMDFAGFMFFSTLEGLAVYTITLYVFRMNLERHLWHVLTMVLLISLQNYYARGVLTLEALSPLLNLALTALFLIAIIRVPLLWSLVMTVTGYIAFGLLQTVIIFLSLGYLSIDEVQHVAYKGYLLQTVTGVIGIFVSWKLYRKGFGFTYDFERLRFKWEWFLVIGLIVGAFVVLAAIFYYKHVFANLIALVFVLALFLYYSFRKEETER